MEAVFSAPIQPAQHTDSALEAVIKENWLIAQSGKLVHEDTNRYENSKLILPHSWDFLFVFVSGLQILQPQSQF